jgi:hypothetical protein
MGTYPLDFILHDQPAAENSKASEFLLGSEASQERHGSSLTEPTKYDTIGVGPRLDLLRDQCTDVPYRPKHAFFVLSGIEAKGVDIEPFVLPALDKS